MAPTPTSRWVSFFLDKNCPSGCVLGMLKFLGLQNPSLKIGENILPSSKWYPPPFISLAFLPCNQQQRRPSSFCHSGFSNRKCYATMGCVSVQVKLPVVFFHLSRPTTLQHFKKHDLPIRCFSAATPREWEHGKCLPSNPPTKPLEITIHRSSQLLYVELLDCPWASLSKRRTLVHHQSLVFAFLGIIKAKVASSLKVTTSRDISSIEIRLL